MKKSNINVFTSPVDIYHYDVVKNIVNSSCDYFLMEHTNMNLRGNALEETLNIIDVLGETVETVFIFSFDTVANINEQMALVETLKEKFPYKTFYITANNPFMCLGLEVEEFNYCNPKTKEILPYSTMYQDVGSISLRFFSAESLVGRKMSESLVEYSKLRLKDKEQLSEEDLNRLVEIKDVLGNTVATNFIYNTVYFAFLKFLKNHPNNELDFELECILDGTSDLSEEELDILLVEFVDNTQSKN